MQVHMINLPKFNIGDLEMNIIQGAMGVGVSRRNLVSAVANCGGAGIIASVGLGFIPDYGSSYTNAQGEALRTEIRATREMTDGVVGVNIMRALTDYKTLVEVSVEENIDMIITGAGIARDLPDLVGDKPISLVPIVSDVRYAKLITKLWAKYGKVPDAFIVEGPEAGGHLGFKYEDLINGTVPTLEEISRDVIDYANNPEFFTTPVPVVVAGGIYTGQDIAYYRSLGAAGVQMATRFVTTKECDASYDFKIQYVNATKEDIKIIKSPVGMPGRAIDNDFLRRVAAGENIDFVCAYDCLIPCDPDTSPYCIAEALIEAYKGNFVEGFPFAGSNAYRATRENCMDKNGEFITVRTLMQRLSDEYEAAA